MPTLTATPEFTALGSRFRDLLGRMPGTWTFGMIKPDAFEAHKDEILAMIEAHGLKVEWHQDRVMSEWDIRALYFEHIGRFYYDRNAEFIGSGPVRQMLITGPDALNIWRQALMPMIRDRWGTANNDPERKHLNLVHGADSLVAAFREVHYFMG